MSGINVPQILLAGVEGYILTEQGNKALLYAVAVAISNLLPGTLIPMSAAGEKYIVEPAAAGIVSLVGNHFMSKNDRYMKTFAQGFLIGSSSAAVYGALLARNLPISSNSYNAARAENIKNYPLAGPAINSLLVA